MSTHAVRSWLCVGALAALIAVFALRTWPHLHIETDLLALLPSAPANQAESLAVDEYANRASRRMLFLVGDLDASRARNAAAAFAQALRASRSFEAVEQQLDASVLASLRDERDARFGRLSARHRALLENGEGATLRQEALGALYSPIGLVGPFSFADDPFGLSAAYLRDSATSVGAAHPQGDALVVERDGKTYALVAAVMRDDPFALAAQDLAMDALTRAKSAALAHAPDAEILTSGVLPHAAAGARQAQLEIGTFGSLGLAGVILLMLATFRSMRPLLLTMVALAVAALAGFVVCHEVFGNVHVLTLTFGTSLTGVAVDYSVHYFAARLAPANSPPEMRGDSPTQAIAHLSPSLLTVCGTTIVGYLALFVAPIEGLRQIALFSAAGLVAACACVIGLYPWLDRGAFTARRPLWVEVLNARSARGWLAPRALAVIALAVVVVGAFGASRLRPVDDIRSLQRSPAALMQEEARVRDVLALDFDTRFVLVTGASAEEVLQREEQVTNVLRESIARGDVRAYLAVSSHVPSLQRQRDDYALLARTVYAAGGDVEVLLAAAGFDRSAIDRHRGEFLDAAQSQLDPESWLASPASAPFRQQWLGRIGDRHASVVALDGLVNPEAVRKAVSTLPGVRYVDRVAEISAVLTRYREVTTVLLGLVIVLIAAVLALRYGPRPAMALVAPPFGAALLTLAALAALGQPFTLLHVLSLLLVLGMGVDYSVFLRQDRNAAALLAVGICTLTTLLSFGLLGFSSVPFVRAIGLTVSLGISFAFLLSFVARPRLV